MSIWTMTEMPILSSLRSNILKFGTTRGKTKKMPMMKATFFIQKVSNFQKNVANKTLRVRLDNWPLQTLTWMASWTLFSQFVMMGKIVQTLPSTSAQLMICGIRLVARKNKYKNAVGWKQHKIVWANYKLSAKGGCVT